MDYICIPVELCKYALMKHKVNQLRLFIFLKSKCSGHLKLPKERIDSYCKELSFKTPKTFNNNLNWLLNKEWITVNTKSGNYRIKGFVELSNKLKFSCTKVALFEPMDFSKFKPFIIATVITYYMKFKSRVDKKRSVWKKGHTRKNRFKNPAFFSLPHTYLAKVLNIPKSTAEYYRFIAIKSKFIISKSDFEILDVQGKEINLFKKYHDNSSNLRVLNGNLHKQKDNKLFSKIIIRTKKKLKKNLKLHGNFLYR